MRPIIAGLLLALLIAGGVALAQSGVSIVSHSTSPGGVISGGGYTLKGVAGQAETPVLTGGGYTLTGGLVAASGPESNSIFLPAIHTR